MFIDAMATIQPETRVPLQDLLDTPEVKRRELVGFERLFGHHSVQRFEDDVTTAARLGHLLDKLVDANMDLPIDAVIYAHALPLQSAEAIDTLAELCENHPALGPDILRYEVDQFHCASGIWALRLAQTLLNTGLAKRVVILIGDHLHQFDQAMRYVPGVTALGDGFAGLICAKSGSGPIVSQITLDQTSEFPHGALADRQELDAFFRQHSKSVSSLLQTLNHAPGELLLGHNINFPAWRGPWLSTYPKPEAVDLSLIGARGHCFAADPFLLLAEHMASQGDLTPTTLLAVGLGSFFGACRIQPNIH